jgi:hypothetical protein
MMVGGIELLVAILTVPFLIVAWQRWKKFEKLKYGNQELINEFETHKTN